MGMGSGVGGMGSWGSGGIESVAVMQHLRALLASPRARGTHALRPATACRMPSIWQLAAQRSPQPQQIPADPLQNRRFYGRGGVGSGIGLFAVTIAAHDDRCLGVVSFAGEMVQPTAAPIVLPANGTERVLAAQAPIGRLAASVPI